MHQNFDYAVCHFIEYKLIMPKYLRTSFLERMTRKLIELDLRQLIEKTRLNSVEIQSISPQRTDINTPSLFYMTRYFKEVNTKTIYNKDIFGNNRNNTRFDFKTLTLLTI